MTNYRFESGGLSLAAHLAEPRTHGPARLPGLVICHGFPTAANGSMRAGHSYHDLADRIASDMGWVVLAVTFRGCGESEGSFSLGGWLADLHAAAATLRHRGDVRQVFLAGFGTGGALAICAGADDPDIGGVAAVAPPADFDDWASDPEGLLDYARRVGAIRDPGFPADAAAWASELSAMRAVHGAERLAPRPLLVLHGANDDVVPTFDARVIADAHGHADFRLIAGAGHRLRFDPRAVAVLLGWLDRTATAGIEAVGQPQGT